MFGLKKNRAPTQPFTHADDCKIVKADPTTQIEWWRSRPGHWEAVCQCGAEDYREPPTVGRDRLDPYDPSTFRHAAQLRAPRDRDPVLLKAILKVRDGVGGATGGWNAPPVNTAGRSRTTPSPPCA
jgi:hypothetical protein